MASPSVSSSALSRRIVVPERTVTCPVSRSTRSTPVQWRRSSASESATAIAVKECPLPQGRTVRPAAAMACDGRRDLGHAARLVNVLR